MNRTIPTVLTLVVPLLCLVGCRQEKSLGPLPIFPEGGTQLYITECDPIADYPVLRENVTLSADPAEACPGGVEFRSFYAFSWRSNVFASASGTLREGYHLVFERSVSEAADSGTIVVQFHGLAVNFRRDVILPAGETVTIVDEVQSGTVPNVADTAKYVGIFIQSISDTFRLKSSFSQGSYLYTEAYRNELCEFAISLGLSQGIGQPNGGVNFSYQNVTSTIQSSFLHDFTGGASVANTFFHFGPDYGVCYFVAVMGACSDTAMFWASAPAEHYRTDTLGQFDGWPSLLSDGQHVWLYGTTWLQSQTGPRRQVKITYTNDVTLLTHSIWDSVGSVRLALDRANQLIWIVERFADAPDTAWGYSLGGDLDSVIVNDGIPFGNIHQGQWIIENMNDAYVRTIRTEPLTGGSPVTLGEYPTDLSNAFAGEAGFAYPGVGHLESWSLNVFDENAHWIARYPLTAGGTEDVDHVKILLADEVIVYVLYTYDSYSMTLRSHIRALQPN